MTPLHYRSDFQIIGDELPAYHERLVKNEPMLFSCDTPFALEHGGPITQGFFECLPREWRERTDLVWDSRVHMLMPGWFPCIPGWHLDDIPRTRADGQPDHANPSYRAEHVMAIVGDASRTTFARGELTLHDFPVGSGKVVYGEWHTNIEQLIAAGKLEAVEAPVCRILQFDDNSFHRGTAATKNGWRWFVRVTRKSQRPVLNEIRRQVQVYMPAPDAGW